jgi:hypothetical protein
VRDSNGYLDVQNATLRSSKLEAVSNIGIANTAPQHAFSVGSNLYVDTESSNVLTVDGNVVCEGVKVGLIEIIPSYDLAAVSNVGNVTQSTIQFSNATTSFVTTANATIGNILTVEGNASINGNLSVTSNLEVGTANLFVDTTNSRVGVGTSIPTESLDVVGNMNLQQVSNTASIKLNSNVVTEFPRSKKLIKYPRVALTSAAETGGYQGYIVTRSSQFSSYNAWEAFDENNPVGGNTGASHGWVSTIPGTYSVSTGAETGTVQHHSGSVQGEWIQIQLPESIYLHDFVIESRSEITYNASGFDHGFPEGCVLYGSNDGSSWVVIKSFTTVDKNHSRAHTENINETTQTYKYFALVVNSTHVYQNTTQVSHVSIGQIRLFGTPEYDPEADGVDVVVKSVPNVPNTDWLEVYYDAKDYSGSGDVQDESGNDRDAEMNATFDNGEIKAFNFSGVYTSNVTTSDHGLGTGDVTYTVSYWFKRIRKRNTYDYLYIMGNGGSVGQASLMWILNEQLTLDHWSTQTRYFEPIQNNRWYHVAAGHRGGEAVTNDFLFIDGQNVGVSVSTPQPFDLQGSKLTLGTSHNSTDEFLEGSIANFRLFNRALTSDEIWQLYAYQKEYFGHGDLGMTLKAGRLGIGTSEPKAALDVNGTLRVGHDRGASMQTSMVIADGGNVGIGTDDASRALEIARGGGSAIINLKRTDTGTGQGALAFLNSLSNTVSSISASRFGDEGGELIFRTAPNDTTETSDNPYLIPERMRIDADGNVGIGTANPTQRFVVAKTDNVASTPVMELMVSTAFDNPTPNPSLYRLLDFSTFADSGKRHCSINLLNYNNSGSGQFDITERLKTGLGFSVRNGGSVIENALSISYTGDVGINDSTPSYTLDVNGTISANNVSPSDDRIKYNEQNVSNALTLISQLNPQKYEKIMERPNPTEGTWIPTDEEWENVKEDYTYGDEFGFIAQDVRNIPELSFLVSGEETRTDTKTSTPEEYSNLTTEEQATYTPSYVYESNVITQEEYSNLSPEEQEVSVTQYTKQIETQTPLALNYQGLFVVAIGAIKELKAKNESLEARITALENA